MTTLDFAHQYRAIGWSIIPAKPRDKLPVLKWTPYQSRLATDEEIASWFGNGHAYNIAIATGAISQLLVLDCDSDDAVAEVERRNLAPRRLDVRDQVALGDLLVVDVVHDLAGRIVDRLADLVRLRDLRQEQTGVVLRVERLEHDHEALRRAHVGARSQVVDDVGRLVVPGQALVVAAGDGQRPHPEQQAEPRIHHSPEGAGQAEGRQAQEFWKTPRTFFVPAFTCEMAELISLGMPLLKQPASMMPAPPWSRSTRTCAVSSPSLISRQATAMAANVASSITRKRLCASSRETASRNGTRPYDSVPSVDSSEIGSSIPNP